MMYYKVKKEYADTNRYMYIGSTHYFKQYGVLIANELYTPCERKKIANSDRFFDIVEIPKNKTYRFFGARFASDEK